MKIAITDANILIDVIELGFIDHLFQIELELHTTLGIVDELNNEQQDKLQKYIDDEELTIHFPSEEELHRIKQMEFDRGFSNNDCYLLYICKENEMILLSGERKMRTFCNRESLEVHGVIWLFDEFIRQSLISHLIAIEKMEALLARNEWLPVETCKKRIATWKRNL